MICEGLGRVGRLELGVWDESFDIALRGVTRCIWVKLVFKGRCILIFAKRNGKP
jgi:hypothetical protein